MQVMVSVRVIIMVSRVRDELRRVGIRDSVQRKYHIMREFKRKKEDESGIAVQLNLHKKNESKNGNRTKVRRHQATSHSN